MDFSNLVTPEVTQAILGIVSMALVYVIQKAGAYLKTKTENTKIDSAIQMMDKILVTAVKGTEQTLKKDLISSRNGGKLTPGQQNHLRHNALDILNKHLTDSAIKQISKQIPDIQEYALNKVEDIVHDIKASQETNANIISVIDSAVERGAMKSIPRMAQNGFGLNGK